MWCVYICYSMCISDVCVCVGCVCVWRVCVWCMYGVCAYMCTVCVRGVCVCVLCVYVMVCEHVCYGVCVYGVSMCAVCECVECGTPRREKHCSQRSVPTSRLWALRKLPPSPGVLRNLQEGAAPPLSLVPSWQGHRHREALVDRPGD